MSEKFDIQLCLGNAWIHNLPTVKQSCRMPIDLQHNLKVSSVEGMTSEELRSGKICFIKKLLDKSGCVCSPLPNSWKTSMAQLSQRRYAKESVSSGNYRVGLPFTERDGSCLGSCRSLKYWHCWKRSFSCLKRDGLELLNKSVRGHQIFYRRRG